MIRPASLHWSDAMRLAFDAGRAYGYLRHRRAPGRGRNVGRQLRQLSGLVQIWGRRDQRATAYRRAIAAAFRVGRRLELPRGSVGRHGDRPTDKAE